VPASQALEKPAEIGDTKTRLLDAAMTVVRTRGIAKATSRELASVAGTNLQAITYHFGSKDELIAQALVAAVRTWVEPTRTALRDVAQDPVGHLIRAVMTLQETLAAVLPHFPGYFEALAAAPRSEPLRQEIVGLLRELRDDLAARITELRDTGLLADWVQPEPMAALIVAAGDGFALHTMLDPEAMDPDRLLDQVIQLLLAARNLT
jgi:AcrR family transcriptional regulator